MIMNDNDIGNGMTYCKSHKYWRVCGTKCEDCEKELITKCVECENDRVL